MPTKRSKKRPEITLAHILARLEKIDSKLDDRTELLKSEIQGLESQMDRDSTRLNSKVEDGFAKVESSFAKVDRRLDRIEDKLDMVYRQTGRTNVEVTGLKSRVAKLEGPNA